MKVNRRALGVIAAAAMVTGAVGGCAAATAATSSGTPLPRGVTVLTAAGCRALEAEANRSGKAGWDWGEQGRLDQIVTALDEQRAGYADTFSSVSNDVPGKKLMLYATDIRRAGAMIQAALTRHPHLDTQAIRICRARYSQRAMESAMKAVMALHDPTIYSAAAGAPDGWGIQVSVKPGTEHRRPAYVAHVRVTWKPGSPAVPA